MAKKDKKASVVEIVAGIHQAAANCYDGAQDKRLVTGDPVSSGLKREKGDILLDSRFNDGFRVKVTANRMGIFYHEECRIRDVAKTDIEQDVAEIINDVAIYLKKEYRKIVGSALSIKPDKEIMVDVQYISRLRTSVRGEKWYTVGNLDEPEPEHKLDRAITDWISLGRAKL